MSIGFNKLNAPGEYFSGEKREYPDKTYSLGYKGISVKGRRENYSIPLFFVFVFWVFGINSSLFFYFFPFIFISWRLITLQYCSGFCHTLT